MAAVVTSERVCLRCLGQRKVDSLDGGALGQARDHATRAIVCPSCQGTGVITVVAR